MTMLPTVLAPVKLTHPRMPLTLLPDPLLPQQVVPSVLSLLRTMLLPRLKSLKFKHLNYVNAGFVRVLDLDWISL